MSQENVEVLRDALNRARDDPEAFYRVFDPDVEWDHSANVPYGGVLTGVDGVRQFFRRWIGTFEEWGFRVEEMIDAGDQVFVLMEQFGRGTGSGAEVSQRFAQVWTFRDRKITRFRAFRNREEALEAAGLRE